jgi:hypothetical protein
MSSISSKARADTKPDTAGMDHAMLPASPTDSQSDRAWHDNTYDFNMAKICATVRDSDVRPAELVKTYHWYPEAVAVDALLPPGVPLSLREVCIYYPHHVRWQGVMLRLTHNDYRGPDILDIQVRDRESVLQLATNLLLQTVFRGSPQDHMSPPVMNQIQRDAVQRLLPAFKTNGYEGEGDSDMRTDQLKPGEYLEKKVKGYTLPTFDDLLHGLNFTPTGPDVRGLTQCLTWYLKIRNTFQPRLEFNVLHAQALIRALRLPLEPVGIQNLNRYALEYWRKGGAFDKIAVTKSEHEGRKGQEGIRSTKFAGERAVVDTRNNTVKAEFRIPFRNILSFPFLALHGVISEALKMGIDKAERRRAARKGMSTPTKRTTSANHAPTDCANTDHFPKPPLKRPRKAESGEPLTPAQTPKRRRRLNDGPSMLEVRTPRRPTVSPITPRTSTQQIGIKDSHGSLVKLEFGLRQRKSARHKP